MEKKKRITIYEDKNDPYLDSLRQGFMDTPQERFTKFFEQRRKFNEFMGIKRDMAQKKTIVIKEVTWI